MNHAPEKRNMYLVVLDMAGQVNPLRVKGGLFITDTVIRH
jgi:hypothetical protein